MDRPLLFPELNFFQIYDAFHWLISFIQESLFVALNNSLSNDKLISRSSRSNKAIFPLQNYVVACVIWICFYFLCFKNLSLLS